MLALALGPWRSRSRASSKARVALGVPGVQKWMLGGKGWKRADVGER